MQQLIFKQNGSMLDVITIRWKPKEDGRASSTELIKKIEGTIAIADLICLAEKTLSQPERILIQVVKQCFDNKFLHVNNM